MFGAIVLRDIPKEEVGIDLNYYRIQGGFRGFSMVPPACWHYVSVKINAHHVGFWCFLSPMQAVVKVFNSQTNTFEDADADTQAQYSQLALNSGMGSALMMYPHAKFGPWFGLVNKIPKEPFPPTLHERAPSTGVRFKHEFFDTHHGDHRTFLAEFQYAFAQWLVSQKSENSEEFAFNRWRDLLTCAYNAGETLIAQASELFADLVETVLRQFATLPDEWFVADSFIMRYVHFLTEDMRDTGLLQLVEKSEELTKYLAPRSAAAARPKDPTPNATVQGADGTPIVKLRNKDDLNRITGGQHRLRALLLFDYQVKIEDITEIWVNAANARLDIHLPGTILRFQSVPGSRFDVIMPTEEDLNTVAQRFDPALANILSEIFQAYGQP